MDKISGLNQIMEILRRQTSEHTRLSKTRSGNISRSTQTSNASTKPNTQKLEQKISGRIKKLDASDANTPYNAGEIFVQSVLAWEFGEHLLDDPQFMEMTRQVHTQLTSNKKLAAQFSKLIRNYLK